MSDFAISYRYEPKPIYTQALLNECEEIGQNYSNPFSLGLNLGRSLGVIKSYGQNRTLEHEEIATYLKGEVCQVLSGKVAGFFQATYLSNLGDAIAYMGDPQFNYNSEYRNNFYDSLFDRIGLFGKGIILGGEDLGEVICSLEGSPNYGGKTFVKEVREFIGYEANCREPGKERGGACTFATQILAQLEKKCNRESAHYFFKTYKDLHRIEPYEQTYAGRLGEDLGKAVGETVRRIIDYFGLRSAVNRDSDGQPEL